MNFEVRTNNEYRRNMYIPKRYTFLFWSWSISEKSQKQNTFIQRFVFDIDLLWKYKNISMRLEYRMSNENNKYICSLLAHSFDTHWHEIQVFYAAFINYSKLYTVIPFHISQYFLNNLSPFSITYLLLKICLDVDII